MTSLTLTALSEFIESEHRIMSPAVGYFSVAYAPGTWLSPGGYVGKFKIINTVYHIYLPKNIQGSIVYDEERDKAIPVGYGQELFRLRPGEPGELKINKSFDQTFSKVWPPAGLPTGACPQKIEDGYVVTAFTAGIFYSSPSPGAPPFVTVGQKIEKGKALGLIEVMKTFNQILFQGTDSSDSGTIKKIYVENAAEIKSGQPLFLIF